MSAPNTDPEKQQKRHRGSLFGVRFALIFAAVILVAFVVYTFAVGNDPADGDPNAVDSAVDVTPDD